MNSRFFRMLIVLAFVIQTAFSCRLDRLSPDSGFKVNASIHAFDTRVEYGVEGHRITPKWEVGDTVFGFDDAGGKFVFTVARVAENGAAELSTGGYKPGKASRLYAVYYPGKGIEDISADFEIPVDITLQEGRMGKDSPALMCASAEIKGSSADLVFDNAVAIVGVERLKAEPSKVLDVLTLNGACGKGRFVVEDGALRLVADRHPDVIKATGLNLETGSDGVVSSPVYVMTLPTEGAVLTVELSKSGSTLIYSNLISIPKMDLLAGTYYHTQKTFGQLFATIVETGQNYESFEDAVAAANTSSTPCTIRLINHCVGTGTTINNTSGQKITIDFNGKQIDLVEGTYTILSETEMVDSSDPLDGAPTRGGINAFSGVAIHVTDGAHLTLSAGNITCSKESTYTIRIDNGAHAVVEHPARIVSKKYRCMYLYGSADAKCEASLNVNGGWFECAEGQSCIVTSRTTSSGAHRTCFLGISGGYFRHAGSDYSASNRCIYRGYDNCAVRVSGGFFDTDDIYRHGSQSVHNYTVEGGAIVSTQTDFPQAYAAGYTYYVKVDRGVEAAHSAIRKAFEEAGTANLVVYAAKGGSPIYSAAFGYRCKEKGNVDTLEFHDIFRIASISKSFTGAAMMLLVEQGKVDIKDKVNDYFARLPEGKRFTVVNPAYPDVPITIEMLLNHTASIQGSQYGVEEFAKNITYTSNKPGTVYDYSNMGTTVAGAIVEIASGERLDKFVKANFLDRIGMSNSGYDPALIDTLSGPRFTHLYNESGTRYYTGSAYKPLMTAAQEANYVLGYNTGLISPPGNMKTNAEQLMMWARTLQAGGVSPDGVRVLSEESVRKMHNNTGPGSRYGYYLYSSLSRIPGKVTGGHNGGAYGAHTSMYYGLSFDAAGNMVPPAPGSGDDWVVIVLSSGGTAGEALEDDITRIIYYTLVETNQYSSAVL